MEVEGPCQQNTFSFQLETIFLAMHNITLDILKNEIVKSLLAFSSKVSVF